MPNLVTAGRAAAAVLLAAAVLCSGPPVAAVAICVGAAGSDYLDGYLARRGRQESDLGAALDPLADKLFVVTALVLLSHTGKIGGMAFWAVLVIIWREVLIAGVRAGRRASGFDAAVVPLAKLKTAFQYLAVILLFAAAVPFSQAAVVARLGVLTLWIAAGLSLVTGAAYIWEWRQTWK